MINNRFEFYGTPEGEVIISENGQHRTYEMADKAFTSFILERIKTFHSEAYKALCETYCKSQLNKSYCEYLIVRRFIKCNFSQYDNIADLEQGIFKFEFVPCPLRGECKYDRIICCAKYDTKLTERENEVMKHYCVGLKADAIAEKLFISIETVKTHKRNALQKLGMTSISEFIAYAAKNRIYENDNDK